MKPEPKGFKVYKDQQVHKVKLEPKEFKVYKGQLVQRDLKVKPEPKVFKVYKDRLVQRGLKVRQVLKVPQAKLQPYQLELYLVEKVPQQLLLVPRQIMF